MGYVVCVLIKTFGNCDVIKQSYYYIITCDVTAHGFSGAPQIQTPVTLKSLSDELDYVHFLIFREKKVSASFYTRDANQDAKPHTRKLRPIFGKKTYHQIDAHRMCMR